MFVVDLITNYISPFQAALVTSLLLFFFVYLFLKDNDLPPGPIGLPVLGYWPFLKPEICHIQLKKMVEKFGDIFSFRVTGKLFIHLASFKAIREAHLTKSDCFGGRFTGFNLLNLIFLDGVTMLNGEAWKTLRKFFLSKFKEYGMNAVKENTTSSIHDALSEFIEELHKSKGQPVAITDMATAKCCLVMRRILFNDQGITIEEMQELIHQYTTVANAMKSTNFLLFDFWAKYIILPMMPCYWRMRRANSRIQDILLDVIKRHEKEYDETQALDIVDCYIKEREERKQKEDPTANYFTAKALVGSLNQFVSDGVLTVGLFFGSFLISVIQYSEEQDKIYKELLEVIGPERLPTIEDKPNLPYTNAFMYEVMRMSEVFPLFPSQLCTKETTMQGHKIPKGAITLINTYAAHMNPESFDDPETFNPSRYLTSENKTRPELPIMFGVGKRSCIGEGFTMLQSFLFFTTIVKNFHLSLPENSKIPSNLLWSEERLHICATPRSQKEKS